MTPATLVTAAQSLARRVGRLRFGGQVAYVYNPLEYAWQAHRQYLERYGRGPKRVVFLGMNPGPFGMMQTGVPFGEVAAVRDWMGIEAPIETPRRFHPKRPIDGFACTRAEVSGRRLWGWVADRFGSPEAFFSQAFVVNYCPLVFLEAGGRNLTPDKLPSTELAPLQAACDGHLRQVVSLLSPEWVIGVGAYATKRLQISLASTRATGAMPMIGQILHPSPASPLANRGWAEAADRQLTELGVF
ncbi:MAG: single-stranded DNA-binding protein [Burkholderiaceae bacterium]